MPLCNYCSFNLDACICSYSLILVLLFIFHPCHAHTGLISEPVFVVACDQGFQDVCVLSHYLLMRFKSMSLLN